MKVGVRGELFLFSILLIVTVVVATGLYLEPVLGDWLEKRIEDDLLRSARATREMVLLAPTVNNIPEMDRLADRFGRAINKRITLIAADGHVLGDSKLTPGQIHDIDNHGNRPEVKAARESGYGLARRFSTTVGTDMLYVAIPFQHRTGTGVVRVVVSLESVDGTIRRLRMFLAIAGMVAMGVTALIAAIASHLLTRTLRGLMEHAERMTAGTLGRHLVVRPEREIGGLAGAFNRIAEDLAVAVSSLVHERHRLETVLEGMSDGVIALDDERRIILINRAASSLTGLSPSPIGQPLTGVIPAPELEEMLQRTPGGESMSVDFSLPGDAERWFEARATRENHPESWVVVLHDITESHRLERMRQEFVANVSHELRTPVSVVLGYTETLLGGAMNDETTSREMLGALRRQAVRLSTVIADLLSLSRLDASQLSLEAKPLPLKPLLLELIDGLKPVLAEKNITPALNLDRRIVPLADAKALSRVLMNLLDNAVKHVPVDGTITVNSREAGRFLRIEVVDNGPGIPPQYRERLFERFFRVDTSRSRKLGGTGLGLAIVKSLVETMDGQVGMEPAPSGGSLFWITLPRPLTKPPETVTSNP